MVTVQDLQGKVVVVTGGGGAIGAEMCGQFAKNGAAVVVADISKTKAETVAAAIREKGGQSAAVEVDVSNRESAAGMVEQTVALFGRLDCLVNNAGINGGPDERKPIHEYSDELWQRIINVDLNGVYYCSKPAVTQMIRQGGGSIINIGSVVGLTPFRLQCAFAAAKAAVFQLTKAMALELAPYGIRVNSIAPGSIMFEGTKQLFYADPVRAEAMLSHIPLHRPGAAEDIAAMTVFLSSGESKYTTGSVVTVDGGWTCGYARDF